jgi:hypothetical protein
MLLDVPRILLTAALAGLPWAFSPGSEGPAAQRVAALRVEADELAETLEAERAATRDELAVLRSERIELERQVRAESARATALERIRAEASTRAETLDEESRRWHAPTLAALAATRTHVERGLPFATERRLDVLQRIERDLATAHPDHARALERLWRFLEEEEALGREVALTQQAMMLDGESRIVDVIRIGMALLYFRTQDGRLGWVHPTAEGWRSDILVDPVLVEVVRGRFEAHERNDALGPAELLVPSELLPDARGTP